MQGLTFFLAYSIFSAVLGMLQFGYNTGVINAPEQVKLNIIMMLMIKVVMIRKITKMATVKKADKDIEFGSCQDVNFYVFIFRL